VSSAGFVTVCANLTFKDKQDKYGFLFTRLRTH